MRMTDDSPTAGAAVTAAALADRVAASRARLEQAQQRAVQAREQLGAARSSATSPDRAVTVTVDAAGTLLDVSFRPAAAKLAPDRLARAVLATYRAATAEAVGRTKALMTELLGAEVPVLDDIARSVSEAEPR
jgi:DNA-binding protein YbaB